jgi:hypothetical protein
VKKGFVIMAQNTDSTDYELCADVLKTSIIRVMPDANVTIITGTDPGFHNDWKVYDSSPYDYTIKLEADMFIPCNIDYWWDTLKERDLVVSTTIRNFKQQVSKSIFYRQFIYENELPDVYNAITYFKKSPLAEQFFALVRNIFENWEDYKKALKCNTDEPATTDWVYAIACLLLGPENTTLPKFNQMSMIHMKQYINNIAIDDWTNELIYECTPDCLRINTFPQLYPFHYHVKNFSGKLKRYYG